MLSKKWLVSGINLDPVWQTSIPDWDLEEKRNFKFQISDERTRCPFPKVGGRDPISAIRTVSNKAWKRQPCSIVHLSGASCQLGGLYSACGRPVAGFGSAGFLKKENASAELTKMRKVGGEASGKPLVILNTGTNNFYHFIVDVVAPASCTFPFLRSGCVDKIIFYGPRPEPGSFSDGFFQLIGRMCEVPIAFEEDDFLVPDGYFLLPRLSEYSWNDGDEFFTFKENVQPFPFYISDTIKSYFGELSKEIPFRRQTAPVLVVSRGHLHNRKIENEDEIIRALMPFGVEVVKMEDYTVEEQIGLIKSARVMVGCHGAGMFNAGFLPVDGAAIEITGRQYAKRSRDFCKITAATGVKYSYIIADEVGDNFHMVSNIGNNIELSSFGIERLVAQCRDAL